MNRRALMAGCGSIIALSGCVTISDGERVDAQGEIEMVVNGDPVDLSQDRFQAEQTDDPAMAFHLHASDDRWYMEGEERVTVAEGLDLLPHTGFSHVDGQAELQLDGTIYDEDDAGTTTTVLINGTEVDPVSYRLQDGDAIRVEVTTDG